LDNINQNKRENTLPVVREEKGTGEGEAEGLLVQRQVETEKLRSVAKQDTTEFHSTWKM
jgi:hypothetical protein